MWKAVNYEVCGRSHMKNSIPCQDKTIYSDSNNINIIALADGAGSAELSHYGAETVVKAACEFISDNFDTLINNEDGKQVKIDILNYLTGSLNCKSRELSCELSALASTFLMVAVKGSQFLICHIGDGVIGYLKDSELKIASKPENGEFANTTTFVTSKDALLSMKLIKGKSESINGFVLMSDGTAESFYRKQDESLAPVLIKMMHRNAILDHDKIYRSIKESFDSVVVNNTQDDCSIAIMSRNCGRLCQYEYMSEKEKCELIGIKYGASKYRKQLSKFDSIVEFLFKPRTLIEISRQLYVKRKYMIRSLDKLLNAGLIIRTGYKFERVEI